MSTPENDALRASADEHVIDEQSVVDDVATAEAVDADDDAARTSTTCR